MRIGSTQTLYARCESPHGIYVGDDQDEVLLPNRFCPRDLMPDDPIEVFVYTDSEDRPVATTQTPLAEVGDFACLRVVDTNRAGAFLDWGLDKDLFCPPKEQKKPMQVGEDHVVRVYLDEISMRPMCTNKLGRFLKTDGRDLEKGQPVKFMVAGGNWELVTVIIDAAYTGSIFPDEWQKELILGEVYDGYIKAVRPDDGRIAVSLRPQGYRGALTQKDPILDALRQNGGRLPVSDRSTPDEIFRAFGLSKGAFKKLIGTLYREGQIVIEADHIRLRR